MPPTKPSGSGRRPINHALLLRELHRLVGLPAEARPPWLSAATHEALATAYLQLAADVRRADAAAESLSALALVLDVSDRIPDELVRLGVLPRRAKGRRPKK